MKPSPSTALDLDGPPVISAQNLCRRFGSRTAVDQVSLMIRPGEFFTLLGPSGCGKTTLLRLLAGLDLPDSGSLQINGAEALSLPAHRRPISMVFQSGALFPHLNVQENVALGLRLRHCPADAMAARVAEALRLARLEGFARRWPAEMSGGERQRVALARALATQPQLLLLDEPLAALEPDLRRQLHEELRQIQRRLNIAMIHVTHLREDAFFISDRLAIMRAGKIIQCGAPSDIYERPHNRFVAEFTGECNFIAGEYIANDRVITAAGLLQIPCPERRPPIGSLVTLAIRPESILAPAPPDSPNLLRGVVRDGCRVGPNLRLTVEVTGAVWSVLQLPNLAGRPLEIGREIPLSLPPAALALLATEE